MMMRRVQDFHCSCAALERGYAGSCITVMCERMNRYLASNEISSSLKLTLYLQIFSVQPENLVDCVERGIPSPPVPFFSQRQHSYQYTLQAANQEEFSI